jgi:hypothetical protein
MSGIVISTDHVPFEEPRPIGRGMARKRIDGRYFSTPFSFQNLMAPG